MSIITSALLKIYSFDTRFKMANTYSGSSDPLKKVEEQLISSISSCKVRNFDHHLGLIVLMRFY